MVASSSGSTASRISTGSPSASWRRDRTSSGSCWVLPTIVSRQGASIERSAATSRRWPFAAQIVPAVTIANVGSPRRGSGRKHASIPGRTTCTLAACGFTASAVGCPVATTGRGCALHGRRDGTMCSRATTPAGRTAPVRSTNQPSTRMAAVGSPCCRSRMLRCSSSGATSTRRALEPSAATMRSW